MQRIALFGGTFDPVHNGHVQSAIELAERCQFERIHMVPCFQPVHRGEPQLSPAERLHVLQLACASSDHLVADDRELRRQGPSYSIDTFESLRLEYGDEVGLFLVMGADAFAHFDRWHRAPDFLAVGNIIIVHRAGEPEPNLASSIGKSSICPLSEAIQCSRGALTSVQLTPWSISSTAIRAVLARGESAAAFLPKSVWEFISKKQLYR